VADETKNVNSRRSILRGQFYSGWIYWQEGVQGGGLLFCMIKNCEQQLQFKYSSQARLCSSEASWWAGGTHDRHNSAPQPAEHPPPPTRSCWIHPWFYYKLISFLISILRILVFRMKNTSIYCMLRFILPLGEGIRNKTKRKETRWSFRRPKDSIGHADWTGKDTFYLKVHFHL
jgi:hypothetical protein